MPDVTLRTALNWLKTTSNAGDYLNTITVTIKAKYNCRLVSEKYIHHELHMA